MALVKSLVGIGLVSIAMAGAAASAHASGPSGGCAGASEKLGQGGLTVLAANPVHRIEQVGKLNVSKPAGVELFVRPAAGISAPLLQRALNCQTSREGGVLGVAGAKVSVSQGSDTFIVRVEASTMDGARQLREAGAALVQR